MTRLCVPITAPTCEAMLQEARTAAEAGAEMIELRLDYLQVEDPPWRNATIASISTLVMDAGTLGPPLVVTCRIAEEGGNFQGNSADRSWLFEAAARVGANFIDLEHRSWKTTDDIRERLTSWRKVHDRNGRARIILSQHDFEKTPADLPSLLGAMAAEECDVIKLAAKATNILDSIRMLDALREWAPKRPTIALSMGETGLLTRVLAKKLGAFLTFASLAEGKESAPGQVSIAQMKGLYRWDKLNEKSLLYGVVGCPVAHSMSPAIHNAAFDATSHDGIYLPMRIEPAYEDCKAALDALLSRPWLDLRGLSVTIPHKENLLRYVREHIARHGEQSGSIEPLAARIGVANTLVIEPPSPPLTKGGPGGVGTSAVTDSESPINPHSAIRNPQLRAYNTDYAGALDALTTGMGITRADLRDTRVAVLGAGGAAKAIVAGLRDCGAIVFIYNRTPSKARALAAEFGTVAMPWESREMIDTEIIINCTSIGMWPNIDESPLERDHISPNSVVFDTVYNPIETRLLKDARRRGCLAIDGAAMFVNQAALQFKLWTGLEPPRDLMRQVVVRQLSKR